MDNFFIEVASSLMTTITVKYPELGIRANYTNYTLEYDDYSGGIGEIKLGGLVETYKQAGLNSYQVATTLLPMVLDHLSKIPKPIDVIPVGPYCYDSDKQCPYYTYRNIDTPNGRVKLSHCAFLNESDSKCNDEDFERLKSLHNRTDDDIWDDYPLDLLWDECKECNENWGTPEDYMEK